MPPPDPRSSEPPPPDAFDLSPMRVRPSSRPRRLPVLPVAIAVVALLAGGALFVSGYSMGRQSATEPGTPTTSDEAFRPFWDTYQTITGRYAGGPVDREALVQGAIRGMIQALGDPYSAYMSSKEYRQSLETIGGRFEGIGAELATQSKDGSRGCSTLGATCRLLIVSPLDGSPAKSAGLLSGDLVLAADGVAFDGLSVDGARDRIRGPSGSVVRLTVQRGSAAPFPLDVTRAVIERQEVVSRDLAGGTVGYVRLNGFSDRAADAFVAAVKAHVDAGRTRLIVDLRGNPGGYVTAARVVASQFIGSGAIFYEQDASGAQVATDALPGGVATSPDLKIVCLIDGASASASEIVAGALQDSHRATLVGTTSFGKGTVQQWQELTGQGGAFRLTVARWLTPDKRWIHGVGLVPDVVVAVPPDLPAGADPTLDRALDLLGGSAAQQRRPIRPVTLALTPAIE
jgi:carboxyl-terminal processing protease